MQKIEQKRIKEALNNLENLEEELEKIFKIAEDIKEEEEIDEERKMILVFDLLEQDGLYYIGTNEEYIKQIKEAESMEDIARIEEFIKDDIAKKEFVAKKIEEINKLFKKGLNILKETEKLEELKHFIKSKKEIETATAYIKQKKIIRKKIDFVNFYKMYLLLVQKNILTLEYYTKNKLGKLLKQKKQKLQTQQSAQSL